MNKCKKEIGKFTLEVLDDFVKNVIDRVPKYGERFMPVKQREHKADNPCIPKYNTDNPFNPIVND